MIEGSDRSLDFDRNWHGPEDLKPNLFFVSDEHA